VGADGARPGAGVRLGLGTHRLDDPGWTSSRSFVLFAEPHAWDLLSRWRLSKPRGLGSVFSSQATPEDGSPTSCGRFKNQSCVLPRLSLSLSRLLLTSSG
jgi:hypothetical protein